MTGRVYLDSSAAVKLVVAEPGSVSVREFVASAMSRISSRILAVELPRAVTRSSPELLDQARAVLGVIDLVELDEDVTERAAGLQPVGLRSLDAIHIASALAMGDELDAFVTYDPRQVDAAQAAGLPVVSPS